MALSSRGLIEVGISMTLRDNFSKQAGQISQSYHRMLQDMNDWNRGMSQSLGAAFDYGMKALSGMTDSFKHYAAIQGEVFLTSKIAGATIQEQKELMDLTRQVNKETPLTNADIASGERFLAMAGNSATQIKQMIRPASQLASIFQMNLGGKGGVADLMTNMMATFGIDSSQAQKTADILYTATTNANISLQDLAQSLQYSGAVFRNAGVDIAEASTAIGILGDQGIQASSAGTALANMVRYLTLSIAGQKVKGTSFLKKLGIEGPELVTAQGNLRDLGTIMDVLAKKMAPLNAVEREQAMYNIFGVRGERAAYGLFHAIWNGSDKYNRVLNKARNSDGATQSTMDEWMKTSQGLIFQLNAMVDNLKTTIGENLAFTLNPIIQLCNILLNVIERISSTWAGGFLTRLIFTGTAIGVIVSGFKLLRNTITLINGATALLKANTTSQGTQVAANNTQYSQQLNILQQILRTQIAITGLQSGAYSWTYKSGWRGPGGQFTNIDKMGKQMGLGTTVIAAGGSSTLKHPTSQGMSQKMSRLGTIGKGLTGVGRGLLGFLGGPWGLALTGIATLLPTVISAIQDNTETKKAESMAEQSVNYRKEFLEALRVAGMAGKGENKNFNLIINGMPVGEVSDGDSININEYLGVY